MRPPPLHGYQKTAIEHLLDNSHAALFMEMGLGKTATTLMALTDDHLPALVVAPKRVIELVWPRETELWRPDLTIATASGNPKQRARALDSSADLVLISRDNVRDATDKRLLGKWNTVVLDELSSFKNRASIRWKAARKICTEADHVWGLTGTPASNGLMDLWAQIYLLDRGERLGPTLTAFRGRYFRPGRQIANGVIVEWIPHPETPGHIEDLLGDICLAMRARDWLELPPVTYNRVMVPLDSPTRKAYTAMKKELVTEAETGQFHTAANAAVALGKLMQITAGFLYPDKDNPDIDFEKYIDEEGRTRLAVSRTMPPLPPTTVFHRNKVAAVQEIVDGTGSPCIVFYRYKWERDELLSALPGATLIDDLDQETWDRGQVPVLLTHPQSAGHGLNLQAGSHTVIWPTLPTDLEEYDQGNARVARQGQTHPVVVHILLSPDTVDPINLDRLAGKTSLQDALMRALR